MRPVVTLPDAPGAAEYVETWTIHDAQGCVAHVEVPSRRFAQFRTATVLPTQTTACVTYEPRDADRFRVVYRHPPTCVATREVTLPFGPLRVTVSWPDPFREPGRALLRGLVVQHCPGAWEMEITLRAGEAERIQRMVLESNPEGDLVLPTEFLADLQGGEVLTLMGRRVSCGS
jgi:hypothetical protein